MDVFLSYHSADRDLVFRIRDRLARRGIDTFLDRDSLAPGLPWPLGLERALQRARAVVAVVGPGGLGAWQRREVYFALDRQAAAEKEGIVFPVIPLLLRGADREKAFLFLNTWIDAADDPASDDVIARLEAALANGGPAATRAADERVCPYVGLRAFREDDSGLFFGRDRFVQQLCARVQRRPVVGVVGPSGSGKSSIALAGLAPALRRERPPRPAWEVAVMQPRENPWLGLAGAFVQLLAPEESAAHQLRETAALASTLRDHPGVLSNLVDRALAHAAVDRLALIVDQFEELYTFAAERDRRAFIDAILQAAPARALSVVLTIRADFYGPAIGEHRGLSDALSEGLVNVGPLDRDELRDAIEKPAALVGLTFEPMLVDRILAEVVDRPGRLPLLQFALAGTWNERRGSTLTHEGFERIGGVTGSIGARAEAVYEPMTAAQKRSAAVLMKRLVRVNSGGGETADTKAVLHRTELADPVAWDVAQLYAGPASRLLVVGHDPHAAADTVEIAHEALISNWERLRAWLDEDREFLLWLQRLRHAVEDWERTGHSGETLLRGPLLTEALRWSKVRSDELSPAERAFLDASRRSASRSRTIRRAGVVAAALLLVAIAASALYVADGMRRRSEEVRLRAALSAAGSSTDPLLSAMLLLELKDSSAEGHAVARRVAAELIVPLRTYKHGSGIEAVSIAAGGGAVAVVDSDGALLVYRTGSDSPAATVERKGESAVSLAFDQRGERLIAGFSDGAVLLWRLDDLNAPVKLTGHTDEVTSVAFSADGSLAVTTSEDLTARVWDIAKGTLVRTLAGHESTVRHAAFSPEGSLIATASEDSTARIWKTAVDEPPSVLKGHQSDVAKVAFATDDEGKPVALLTVCIDGSARLWPIEGDEASIELKSRSAALEFDPNTGVYTMGRGRILEAFFGLPEESVLTVSPGGIELRDFRETGENVLSAIFSGRRIVRFGHASPEGGLVVLTYDDQTIEILAFDERGNVQPSSTRRFKPHGDAVVSAVHLASDGYHLATGDDEGNVKVWRVDGSGEPVTPPPGDTELSPDSTVLETDGTNVDWITTLVEPRRRFLFNMEWEHLATAPGRIAVRDSLGRVRVIDLRSNRHLIGRDGERWVAFSPDGSQFVTDYKGALHLRKSDDADGAGNRILPNAHTAFFSPDGTRVVGSTDRELLLWNSKTGRSTHLAPHPADAAFAADGSILFVLAAGTLRAHDRDGKPIATVAEKVDFFKRSSRGAAVLFLMGADGAGLWNQQGRVMLPKSGPLTTSALSPDGSAALLLTQSQGLQLWSRAGSVRKLLAKAEDASFSFDGANVAAIADDDVIIFDTSSAREPVRLTLSDASFTEADFSPRDKVLMTVSDDTAVRLWRTDGTLIEVLARGVDSASFSADGRRIITEGTDEEGGSVRVWSADLSDVMEHISDTVRRTGRCLTVEQRESFLGETREAADRASRACTERMRPQSRAPEPRAPTP